MLKIRTYRFNLFILLVLVVLVSNCSAYKTITFNYLDSYEIPSNLEFQSTKIGGLSGIDYDSGNNTYYLVSDDKSEISPARFYIADINMNDSGIDSIIFSRPVLVLGRDNILLEEQTSDFESIRYNPTQTVLFIADEGGKKSKSRIRIVDTLGYHINDFKLEASYLKNIRSNKSFESLCFSKDFESVFYATEAPLTDDGNIPSLNSGGLVRIIESDVEGIKKKEFLYELEKVPYAAAIQPPWEGTGSDNGLSEILSLDEHEFLTLERSGAYQEDGTFKFTCKVFFVRTNKGNSNTLTYKTVKQEVFDFSKLSNGKFNIEGMTLGPIIKGKQSVVFVSDNNFNNKVASMVYTFTMTYK